MTQAQASQRAIAAADALFSEEGAVTKDDYRRAFAEFEAALTGPITTAPEDRARQLLFEAARTEFGIKFASGVLHDRELIPPNVALRAIQAALAPHREEEIAHAADGGRDLAERVSAWREHFEDMKKRVWLDRDNKQGVIRLLRDVEAAITLPVPSGDGVRPAPDVREALEPCIVQMDRDAAAGYIRSPFGNLAADQEAEAMVAGERDAHRLVSAFADFRIYLLGLVTRAALSTPTQALDAEGEADDDVVPCAGRGAVICSDCECPAYFQQLRNQARLVRNYSNPDDVFDAIPLSALDSEKAAHVLGYRRDTNDVWVPVYATPVSRSAVLEEAAKVAEDHAQTWGLAMGSGAVEIAKAIRSLITNDAGGAEK